MHSKPLKEFFVTFGQKYRHEPHPTSPKINPDTVVIVKAQNYEEAREITFRVFGSYWSFIYSSETFDPSFYPYTLELDEL